MSTSKNILVTGINGFVGPHLARELQQRGCAIAGIGYDTKPSADVAPLVENYIACDLTNANDVAKIDFSKVDAVIHLAGLSSQGMSFAQPARFIGDNSAMLINLFEAALQQVPQKLPRFLVVSSGAVYDSEQPMPLTEQSKVTDNSPYIISKLLTEHLCNYYRKRGFSCVIVRPFNHTGPGQGPGFLIPDLAAQVIAAGKNATIKVGNLKSRRDYTDARDIVRAYADLALANNVDGTLFNLGSGLSRSGEEILALITKAVFGNSNAVTTEIDPSRIRPTDPPEIFCDNSAIRQATGWQPAIDLETTINDYVAWLQKQQQLNK